MSDTDRDAMANVGRLPKRRAFTPEQLWMWKDDIEGYDDWLNELLRDTPESWDGDSSAEQIVLEYVRHLEHLVTTAYGNEGLERWHEGVAHVITAVKEVSEIRAWMKNRMPHVDLSGGTDKAVIGLLGVVLDALPALVDLSKCVIGNLVTVARAAGWVERT